MSQLTEPVLRVPGAGVGALIHLVSLETVNQMQKQKMKTCHSRHCPDRSPNLTTLCQAP